MSFLFSWVIKASGGRPLSGLIAHGTFNVFNSVFTTIVLDTDVFQARFWLHEFLILIVGAIFLLVWWSKYSKN